MTEFCRSIRMNKQEMQQEIERLQKEVKKLDESRYAEVQFSDEKDVLLKDKSEKDLVGTWRIKEDLNDFEFFNRTNYGHFHINGKTKSFEMVNNRTGEVKKYNDICAVRFLEDKSEN